MPAFCKKEAENFFLWRALPNCRAGQPGKVFLFLFLLKKEAMRPLSGPRRAPSAWRFPVFPGFYPLSAH